MEVVMPKIYCSECRHFGFYKEKGTLGEFVCEHPDNVGKAYKEDWLSWGDIKIFIDEAHIKNISNNCPDYEKALI